MQGRPSGVLRINAARISIAMVLQPLLAGFLKACPEVQIELTNDEGYVDIVERGFDAGIRMGESVQKDMVAVPLGGPVSVAVVGTPDYFKRHPAPRHPADLVTAQLHPFPLLGQWGHLQVGVHGRRPDRRVRGQRRPDDQRHNFLGRSGAGRNRVGLHLRATRARAHQGQEAEARAEHLLTDLSWVLPVLPQPAPTAVQAEGLRGPCAGAFRRELSPWVGWRIKARMVRVRSAGSRFGRPSGTGRDRQFAA